MDYCKMKWVGLGVLIESTAAAIEAVRFKGETTIWLSEGFVSELESLRGSADQLGGFAKEFQEFVGWSSRPRRRLRNIIELELWIQYLDKLNRNCFRCLCGWWIDEFRRATTNVEKTDFIKKAEANSAAEFLCKKSTKIFYPLAQEAVRLGCDEIPCFELMNNLCPHETFSNLKEVIEKVFLVSQQVSIRSHIANTYKSKANEKLKPVENALTEGKKRGRRPKEMSKEEKQILERWESGKFECYVDVDRELSKTPGTTAATIDRIKKRRQRRQRKNADAN